MWGAHGLTCRCLSGAIEKDKRTIHLFRNYVITVTAIDVLEVYEGIEGCLEQGCCGWVCFFLLRIEVGEVLGNFTNVENGPPVVC